MCKQGPAMNLWERPSCSSQLCLLLCLSFSSSLFFVSLSHSQCLLSCTFSLCVCVPPPITLSPVLPPQCLLSLFLCFLSVSLSLILPPQHLKYPILSFAISHILSPFSLPTSFSLSPALSLSRSLPLSLPYPCLPLTPTLPTCSATTGKIAMGDVATVAPPQVPPETQL